VSGFFFPLLFSRCRISALFETAEGLSQKPPLNRRKQEAEWDVGEAVEENAGIEGMTGGLVLKDLKVIPVFQDLEELRGCPGVQARVLSSLGVYRPALPKKARVTWFQDTTRFFRLNLLVTSRLETESSLIYGSALE